jgi:hypothetical protein
MNVFHDQDRRTLFRKRDEQRGKTGVEIRPVYGTCRRFATVCRGERWSDAPERALRRGGKVVRDGRAQERLDDGNDRTQGLDDAFAAFDDGEIAEATIAGARDEMRNEPRFSDACLGPDEDEAAATSR